MIGAGIICSLKVSKIECRSDIEEEENQIRTFVPQSDTVVKQSR